MGNERNAAEIVGGGGEVVAHSSVPASHGLSGARSPRVALITEFTSSNMKLTIKMSGADTCQEVQRTPTHLGQIGVDPPWHALQPKNVHGKERDVEADES